MSDGQLITRVSGLLGTSTHFPLRRIENGPGLLCLETSTENRRWVLTLPLDESDMADIFLFNLQDAAIRYRAKCEATKFDGTALCLPRAQGDTTMPERLAFSIPVETRFPGESEMRELRVEILFYNDAPIPQNTDSEA